MGIQQLLVSGGGIEGSPQNQSGGVNNTFNPNGTNTITTGSNATPVNWMSIVPQLNVGAHFWIKFIYSSTTSGGVTTITNNNLVLSLATAQFPSAIGGTGVGAANFTYQLATDSGGVNVVATGTGNTNNTI